MPTREPAPARPGDHRTPGAPTIADLARALGTEPVPAGAGATAVTGATLDSRAVRPGDLYAALPGARAHGADFAAQAAAAGAAVALTDPAGLERVRVAGLPALVADDPRAVLGEVAALVHGHPARSLTTVGVTGTNGKTTTTYLLEALLAAAGWRTGLIGTVEVRVGDERVPSVRTTPEAPDLHALFARMRDAGVRACALEVSSHALRLHRVDGAVLDVAVFTNLSPDHLDFHRDMEDYFDAKAELFTPRRSRRGVVAVDDAWGRRLARTATVPVTTVRTTPGAGADASGAADWEVVDVRASRRGSAFALRARDGRRLELTCPLPGAFNVSNAALAAVAALEAGVPAEAVVRGSAAAGGVPGRMQPVATGAPGEPVVVVDFAHSPDALERVLATLRASTPGRLVVVLGAGGDRDAAKRPAMGAAAARGADVVVVTDDNPRSEDPAAIRAAVLAGAADALSAGAAAEVLEVAGRREAIAAGLARCGERDALLVAGKGHERGQEVAGRLLPFDDAEVAAELLRQRAAAAGDPHHPQAAPPPSTTLRGGAQ